ncbi:hypothetical protein GUITHDRAFT_102656 [Guillardia theta CCMP2712]|uniref:PDZ domain-containing protein n=1 Tax=Guillardia theta (strain CCMP2712) TaxID=905079 RepID=L1JS56_GUITC|nr:hypothetical protein GUITHDRAFT_102656 [Guillardia theta CCMP2712]EKX51386.1 hypothetical protein GUITHDRAFT_102656 [Guillardia theta CCMP2712]|eukprot:XP_005838366.1 hypothetical protein GUITHDRAFT_102656 [Guillardia theta CCMP2712]
MYQPMGMRRSQETTTMGNRAGVGLLFMMTPESPPKIMVKEIVQGGSAWRNGQIKPGDVIVQVGNTNVQNQPLSQLRELILGEQGTWITLGFQRGSTGEFYETSMIRGTQDFLDKHASMPMMSSISREAQHHMQSNQPMHSSNLQAQQQANEMMARKPMQYSSREQEEYDRMRTVLNSSQTENVILRSNLKNHDLQNDRNGEELRGYREALERKEEENRRLKLEEDRAKQEMLADLKRRYDRERNRITQAIERNQHVSHSLSSLLTQLLSLERDLQSLSHKSSHFKPHASGST